MTDLTNNKKGIGRRSFFLPLACLILLLLNASSSFAETATTAVIYPDIREPFRTVFLNIAKGISDSLGGDIETRMLTNADTAPDILNWMRQKNLKAVVTLGNHGFSMTPELSKSVPVIIGGINMSPELLHGPYYGITLNPNPTSLLLRLKAIAPKTTRVTVVYQREQDKWMIDNAMKTARELGITLNAVAVETLQEAAGKYLEILKIQERETDALWLLQDSAVLDEQAVLPMILKEAWDKQLIVFSSNPSFVKRGVLFALYPDNYNMGRSLGEMAKRVQASSGYQADPAAQHIEPLRDLLIAFNIRTAAHLDINYSHEDLDKFDLVFPSR